MILDRLLVPVACVSALACVAASPAVADTVVDDDGTARNVSALGGALVWSRKEAKKDFRLVQMVDGEKRDAPVRGSRKPFDPDLGRDAKGRTLVVYSRCSPMCDVFEMNLASGKERRIDAAARRRCAEISPSRWGSTLVFVREGGRACEPGLYARRGKRKPKRILRTREFETDTKPAVSVRETDIRRGAVVATTYAYLGGSSALRKVLLWEHARSSAKPCALQQQGTGSVFGIHSLQSPVLDGSRVYWARSSSTSESAFERAEARCGADYESSPREPGSDERLAVDDGTVYYAAAGRGILEADDPPPWTGG
jgi:hypothetical protein